MHPHLRSLRDHLPDETRIYLSSLVCPFEMTLSPSVPYAMTPALDSRRVCCFQRGTFSTVSQTSSSGNPFPTNNPYGSNIGYIFASPKLFGVNTTNTTVTLPAAPYQVIGSGLSWGDSEVPLASTYASAAASYTLFDHPVVTSGYAGTSLPASLGAPISPTLINPYLPEFQDNISLGGTADFGISTPVFAPDFMLSIMGSTQWSDSNSDVSWETILPSDAADNTYTQDANHFQRNTGLGNTMGGPISLLGAQQMRLVSFGIRIAYTGKAINRGGQIIAIRNPTRQNMVGGYFGGVMRNLVLTADLPNGVTGVPVPTGTVIYGDMQIPSFFSDPGMATMTSATQGILSGYVSDFISSGYTFPRIDQDPDTMQMVVEDQWEQVVWYPVDPSDYEFQSLYGGVSTRSSTQLGPSDDTASGYTVNQRIDSSRMDADWGKSMGFFIQGPSDGTPIEFKYEIVGHYEFIGPGIRGTSPTAPADLPAISALSAVPHEVLQSRSPSILGAHVLDHVTSRTGNSSRGGGFVDKVGVALSSFDPEMAIQQATDFGAKLGRAASGAKTAYDAFSSSEIGSSILGFIGDLLA